MVSVPSGLALLRMCLAGRVNRHQLIVIEFTQVENRLLKEQVRGRQIRFTDAKRALLASEAMAIGRNGIKLSD